MRRNGFTLIEMMIVIVIMGIMLAMATPKVHDWSASAGARGARTTAVSLLAQARAAAIQNNQITEAQFNGSDGAAVIIATNDTVAKVSFNGDYGASMSPSAWWVRYDPRGIGAPSSSTVTATFSRSGKSSSLTVSGFGRVTQ
jgi:prepilin-type N-terminal cleavage/methylation domain-containing protein